ncbi:MAG TPA: ABC transporter substrate-binding protein [Trichocoleus sp.]|jgi:branched-chain amino acid transport system substrate-binding protein
MSQKNETPVLVLSLLLTLALLGGGLWFLAKTLNLGSLFSSGQNAIPGNSNSGTTVALQDRFSRGERLLDPATSSADKQAGISAIASGDYAQAVTRLEASLKAKRNDPEALIYLNNARIGQSQAYTIAVSVPITSSTGAAEEILRGVAQAQTDFNRAGGVNGVPLKVAIVSDDNNPDIAKQVAADLVKDSSILGVIGHFGSDATLAAAPVYQEGGVVMISPTSTAVQISNLGNAIFRTVPSDRFTASTLSDYLLKTLNIQQVAVYYNSGNDYSRSLKEEFTTALTSDGGQVITEFDLNNSAFNAAQAVAQATQQGAQALVLLPNTGALDTALQVVTANQRKLPLLGGDSVYNPKTLQIGGNVAEGMVVAVPWVLLSNPQSPFVQTATRLWGADINWRTATAYDATQVLIAGLKRDPTRQGIQQTLNDPGFSLVGATGNIKFSLAGDRNQPMQLVLVEASSRSSYGYTFVPVATK